MNTNKHCAIQKKQIISTYRYICATFMELNKGPTKIMYVTEENFFFFA